MYIPVTTCDNLLVYVNFKFGLAIKDDRLTLHILEKKLVANA
ncbi:hypothetical protein SAMN04488587_0194 [Methanococcoides vulcani]|uniref:Uncharacterized protein n=1 Tax=Methanococcoides vulcani TaxID=1353158 RepID=A0A1H9Y301_9EURY|nr:hypothetical protein SAMN04488587_0194 [Methanococcoides vulcani]